MGITKKQYEAAIPKCCAYQTIEAHESIMLCWGLAAAVERGEKMNCDNCTENTMKVGDDGTATVTREMLTAAHGVTLESGDVVLSARLLERIYLAMEQAAPLPQTPFDTCPTCEALARTVMLERVSNGL